MKKALTVLLYLVVIALVFVNLFVFNDRLEQAKQEAYSEGYTAAELDLETEVEKARISGYAKGYEEGREAGIEFAREAHNDPDGAIYWLLFEGEE